MMTETGIIGMRNSGRVEFNPQTNLLGRTTTGHAPHGGREAIRQAPCKVI